MNQDLESRKVVMKRKMSKRKAWTRRQLWLIRRSPLLWSHERESEQRPLVSISGFLPLTANMFCVEPPSIAPKSYTLSVSIFSARELKKPASKRVPHTGTFPFSDNEPWSTVAAQLLVQISVALFPLVLDISNYTVNVLATCVIPKPGLPMNSETDYALVIKHLASSKAPNLIVNATVNKKSDASGRSLSPDKENDKESAKNKKKVINQLASKIAI